MDGLQAEDTSSFESAGLTHVVSECERFEARWREGGDPRIEDFLESVPPALRDRMLRELLAVEVELRANRGESPSAADYLRLHPDWDAAIADVFSRETFESRPIGQPTCSGATMDGTPDRGGTSGRPGSEMVDTVIHGRVAPPEPAPTEPLPERFGRYAVLSLLGRGGYGRVFLAHDEELGRPVAIKVLHPGVLRDPGQVASFLAEARIAAGLTHPGIVRVYDLGRYGEGEAFVVFEYVEGRDLAEVLHENRPSPSAVVGLMARVAEAAHHAHASGLVHRDLKPSNILVDRQGAPHIADFGLALREDAQKVLAGQVAGTPAFMAPEQVRGETHRLDARTDVWALGVILYLGLTGRQPFGGKGRERVFRAVVATDPIPPRWIDDTIPRELERICLKCLAKRMSDRYESAAELADDLKGWLALESTASDQVGVTTGDGPVTATARPPHPTAATAPIVPKGLRPFDLEDADFYPRLVPGPRDRDGLPESIRAWRCRIEEPDPARSFAVGLIYGPSGSGKSSFVRAGLLPRLARRIRTVSVDAHAEGTEARLLAALRREIPGLPDGRGLAGAAAAIRERGGARGGHKVLVVIDQFEQWLHAHPEDLDGELVRALRHCDGAGLQALLLVRDDFWMAITRFLRALEVRPVEGHNSSAVEPFDARHAASVLAELGRALGRIGDPAGPDEARFLDRAVRELAGPDGRIIPVRLTLLAEMLRHREWSPATLRALGGFEGIGEMFLEETFCAPGAPPSHRLHRPAAQAVLKALLPEPSSDLKGRMRPASALRADAGYADRPDDFDELMALLDVELRMVTPVDPSAEDRTGRPRDKADNPAPTPETSAPAPAVEPHYQLTHDYLVPPVRQWLTRKQRETRRGRAELRLATITALWRDRPEARRLPSLLEWLMIVWLTRPGDWSRDERRMMRSATRHVLQRAAAAAMVLAALAWSLVAVRDRERARGLLAGAFVADYQHLADQLPDLDAHRDALRPALRSLEADPNAPPHRRDVARILLYRDRPTADIAKALRERLTSADAQPEEVGTIGDALATHPALAGADALESTLRDEGEDPAARLRAACALRALDPGFAQGPALKATALALAEALLAEHRRGFARWLELLGPAAEALITPLGAICCDPGRDASDQATAAEALAELAGRGRRDLPMARVTTEAAPAAYSVLVRESAGRGLSSEAHQLLRAVLDEAAEARRKGERPEQAVARHDRLAGRQAAAATALAAMGDPEPLWPLLRHRPDPRLRSMLIQRLAAGVLPARLLIERISRPDIDSVEAQALLLAWAESRHGAVPAAARPAIIELVRDLYVRHPHPGVHAAAGLLLLRWRDSEFLAQADACPSTRLVGPDGLGWERGPNGHTFAILPASEPFRMGAPEDEPGRFPDQVIHHRRIGRLLAVSMTEVTLEQLRALEKDVPQPPDDGGETGRAAHDLDWFRAIRYCNRLSLEAGIKRSEWCYPEPTPDGVVVPADAVDKEGFRLPTEAEWEFICRAWTETSRYFGDSQALLSRHAWTWLNSDDRVHSVGQLLPNEFGMFDVLGNVWEWCHDGPAGGYPEVPLPAYPTGTRERPAGDPGRVEAVQFNRAGRDETWRILRGGAFNYPPLKARSAHRDWIGSLDHRPSIGFRVVRTLRQSPGAPTEPSLAARTADGAPPAPGGRGR